MIIFADTKEIIPPWVRAGSWKLLLLPPSETRNVDKTQGASRAPTGLVSEPFPQFVLVNILGPIVSTARDEADEAFGDEFSGEPTSPGPGDGREDEPTAWFDEGETSGQESGGVRDMFDDFEQCQHVELILHGPGPRERFNGRLSVGQAARFRDEGWILEDMLLGDADDVRAGIDS